jgi:phosphoglycolate phosphatase-like HAD superfamily hydrolase
MPKATIFDVDGTLVDSVDLHARAPGERYPIGLDGGLYAVFRPTMRRHHRRRATRH